MKQLSYKVMSIMMMLCASLFTVSCGGDDAGSTNNGGSNNSGANGGGNGGNGSGDEGGENGGEGGAPTVITYQYAIDATKMTAGNFAFYDYQAIATDADGKVVTKALTEPAVVDLITTSSNNVVIQLVGKAKSNFESLIVKENTYQIAEPTIMNVNFKSSDNQSGWFSSRAGVVITNTGRYFLGNKAHFECDLTMTFNGMNGTTTSEVTPPALVDVPDFEVTKGDMIDLGLSVKWAANNVGDEINDFFAWGEVKGKKEYYSWDAYSWYSNGSITKYNSNFTGTKDYKTLLEDADDAVTQLQNKNWRLPTHAEAQELMNKCTWTWKKLNGYEGYWIVGPNGNSIFLPAAGLMEANTRPLYGLPKGRNTHGYYWLKDIDPNANNSGAWFIYFVKTDRQVRNDGPRNYGLKCRGVMDK